MIVVRAHTDKVREVGIILEICLEVFGWSPFISGANEQFWRTSEFVGHQRVVRPAIWTLIGVGQEILPSSVVHRGFGLELVPSICAPVPISDPDFVQVVQARTYRGLALALVKYGKAIRARTARTAITTSTSMKVIADLSRIVFCLIRLPSKGNRAA